MPVEINTQVHIFLERYFFSSLLLMFKRVELTFFFFYISGVVEYTLLHILLITWNLTSKKKKKYCNPL